jgi:hypothetical protein
MQEYFERKKKADRHSENKAQLEHGLTPPAQVPLTGDWRSMRRY